MSTSPRKAPYTHSDGSPCWTLNCSRGHSNDPAIELPSFYRPQLFPKKPTVAPGAWSNKDTVLFKTIHGSKLYGLDHDGSDEDWYVVSPTRYVARKINAKQLIVGDQDVLSVDFKSFTTLASKGVPQALETMFSRKAVSPFFEDYRNGWYASDGEVIHTYMRTLKAFSLTEGDEKTVFKRRRHALRLALNLESIMYTGRFNPTLSPGDVSRISNSAARSTSNYFKDLERVSPIEVDWSPDSGKVFVV